jgi:uncharacterized OB-fold protein
VKKDSRLPETGEGTVLFGMDPIIIRDHLGIDYTHSYAQDSPFFAGLSKGKLFGSRCPACGYVYATPRGHCMECGSKTEWFELPLQGRVHTFTTCYLGSEAFLKEMPYMLILVEFQGANTLFFSRLACAEPAEVKIGMEVKARFRRNGTFRASDIYFVPA